MWRWMENSLQRKLSFIMLVTTLIPLLSLGLFAFVSSSRITEEKTKEAGLDSLRQMQGNLQFILEDVENLSILLIGQSDIQKFARSTDAWDNVAVRTQILSFTTNLVSSKKYLSDITIYPAGASPLSTTTIYASDLDRQVDIRQLKDKMWTGLYSVDSFSGRQNVISFIRPLRSVNNYESFGWLSISLDEKTISRFWSEPMLGEAHGNIALLNEQGTVLSASDKSWLKQPIDGMYPGLTARLNMNSPFGSTLYGQGREKKTVLFYRIPRLGWTLVGLIPFEIYSQQNNYILQLTATIVALTVVVNACLILFFIRRITNPLRVLTRLLAKIDPEQPLPVYPVASSDEIGRLADSYNMLGKHIKNLKEQLIRNEARKKEADMNALQAQINPHFLYNTLSSIHWIALMTEERRIADMVGALSDFLRFSLNKGKEFCPVHQELAHIKSYVQIQTIRFPDKFTVDFAVDPELNDKYMLKLLLQPLVENAMIHGIQKKQGQGTITVCVERKGTRMSFAVQDNGVGMSEEKLAAVRSGLQPADNGTAQEASYGLRNVHQRLLLHYGPESGLQIDSRLHAYTRISFSIPIMEEPS